MQLSYLRFGPADITNIEGVMEGVPHDAFSGWVWNTSDPDADVWVELVGPGYYARICANHHRPDLADAGKRNGRCWFKVLVPESVSSLARVNTVALMAGTSHRLRPSTDPSRDLEAGWLDTQSLDLQLAVSAQRIRFGLLLPPLSDLQIAGVLDAAAGDTFDLSRLVDLVAGLPG